MATTDFVSIKPRPPHVFCQKLLEEAEKSGDWEFLKPYPALLFAFQVKHPDQNIPIARWVSHYRLGKHTWCKPMCAGNNFIP